MSLQHIQKKSPRLLPKSAKFEKNPPNGYRVIRKTKCGAAGAGGAGGAGSSPIHKQASRKGRLIIHLLKMSKCELSLNSIADSQFFSNNSIHLLLEDLSHTKMKNCEYLGKAISSALMLGRRYTPRQWS